MKLMAMSYGKVRWVEVDPKFLGYTGNEVGSYYCWIKES
jgi:hypothetical protein